MTKRRNIITPEQTIEQRRDAALEILQEAIERIAKECHMDVRPVIMENKFVRDGLQVREEWAIIALSPRQE